MPHQLNLNFDLKQFTQFFKQFEINIIPENLYNKMKQFSEEFNFTKNKKQKLHNLLCNFNFSNNNHLSYNIE